MRALCRAPKAAALPRHCGVSHWIRKGERRQRGPVCNLVVLSCKFALFLARLGAFARPSIGVPLDLPSEFHATKIGA